MGTSAPEGGHRLHEEQKGEVLGVPVDGPSTSRGTQMSKRGLAGEKEGLMRKRIVPFAVALLLVVVGCSSSDPATSDEYAALAIPDDVAALTVAWGEAINTGGGAVTELYTTGGFHQYNSQRIAHDDIAAHLEEPSTEGVWVTDPYLLIDEGNDRYVVARGTRAAGLFPGSITFVIVTAANGELEIAQTAWVGG